MTSTTAGFDLGVIYRITDEFILGACLQDIGSKYKWDSSSLFGLEGSTSIEHFPVRKRIGVSYAPQEVPVLSALELEYTARMTFLKLGVEISLTNSFAFRGGIDHLGVSESLVAKPSFGFSLQTATGAWQSSLSYAIVIEPYAPASLHLLSLGVEFQ